MQRKESSTTTQMMINVILSLYFSWFHCITLSDDDVLSINHKIFWNHNLQAHFSARSLNVNFNGNLKTLILCVIMLKAVELHRDYEKLSPTALKKLWRKIFHSPTPQALSNKYSWEDINCVILNMCVCALEWHLIS